MTLPTLRSCLAIACVSLLLGACQRTPADNQANQDPGAPPPVDQPAEDVPPATASAMPPATAAQGPVPGTWEGYGAARFGMSPDEVKSAWDGALDGAPSEGTTCFYLRPRQADGGGSPALMFEEGKFVRYDVGTIADVAPGGGQVGMSVDQIRAAYGARLEEQPHKYVEGGKNLRVKSERGSAAVFEADAAGKITAWRVGVPPQVDYVEGCS